MKKLKLFFALFAMLALGVGNAWAETTISFGFSNWDGVTANFSGTAKDEVTQTVDGVKVTYTRNGSNLYSNTTAIRFYKSNTLKFDAPTGYSIQSIAFTCSSYQTDITSNVGTCTATSSNLSWSGDATSVTFTRPSSASSYATITGATVTLAATSGGSTPDPGTGEGGDDPDTPGAGGSGTIVIKYNSTFTPSLPTASGSVNTTATAHTAEGLSFKEKGIYKGSSHNYLMFAQNKGFIYNTQSLGTITSVSVTYTSETSASGKAGVYFGTAEQSTYTTTSNKTIKGQNQTETWTNTTEGNGFFQLSTSNKNVQITQIAITYTSGSEGGGTEEPVVSLTDEQFNWSAKTATALKGADNNEFPTLKNDLSVPVTYTSSNTSVATIADDGKITLVDPGTTTISAAFAGGEVNETTYKAKTVTYTLTVKQLVSCTDIYNLTDDATFVLKEFVVTYVNGQYTYIKDATGYGLIFNNAGDYGLMAGDQVASGKLEGKKYTYNGLVEIIPTTAADLNAISGVAPAPDVLNTNPTTDNINQYVKFEKVQFTTTKLNSTTKSILGTIEGETDAITFYNQYGADVTFNTSKKYDIVGVVSIYDSKLQVNFISAEEVAEPTLNVKITNADFGKIAIKDDAERTLTLNGSLLTSTVSLAIEGEGAEYFTLASESVDPTDGNITNAKIKITYNPKAEGTHTPTLKITSEGVAEQTIELKGQAAQEYTVHFHVNGDEDETLEKTVLSGNTLEELPEATSCDKINYPTFAGWTTDEIDGTKDVKPTMLDKSTPITRDCDYYAVFAKGTKSSGTVNTSYELVLLPSHFTTSYDERSFKATANEVDGEGTLEISLTSAGVMKSTDASKGNPIQFRKKSSSNPGVLYNTTDLGQINSISYAEGTNNIASTIIGASQQPTEQEDGKGFFMITNGTSVSYIPSITINFTKTSVSEITTYEYITSCAAVVQTCEITYDYADGEGECTTDIVEEGAEYTLCATAPTKAGHTFLHWKDQNGDEYKAGATIDSVAEDLTLTAQWQVNSYPVTWMSLGDEVQVDSTNYNTQPTKPTTALSYTCGIGSKEFVGWTTQEIDGVGVPANLYTDEFPVVTEDITYHAVFASKSAEETTTTSTLLVTEKLGNYASGSMKDDQENVWKYYAGGLQDGETYYIALRNNSEISYIESPKFSGTVQSIVAHVKNGSSKVRTVYLRSSAIEKPAEGDLGETSISAYNNSEVNLNITSPFDKFYIQVSDGLQFHKIVVTSGIAIGDYVDYTTSCPVLELTEGENTLTDEITADVKVNRSFTAGSLYTLSLPFALNAAQVKEIFGDGTTLYQFAQLAKEDDELVLYFSTPSAIAAATPYLIEPAQKVDAGFIVEDATISTTPNNISFTVGATTITMKPILSATAGEKTNGSTEYWLAADRYLYNNENTLLSLRALFNISTVSGMPPRCRVVLGENIETSIDNITSGENTTIKVIENGQLIIIRNGEKFNAQGMRL